MSGRDFLAPTNPLPPLQRARAQDGILIGNQIDKSNLNNPLARRMVAGFDRTLLGLVASIQTVPKSVHEVGCGEGRLTRQLRDRLRIEVLATDFSREIIDENRARHEAGIRYEPRSIYELDPAQDAADLIVCCEVLEHLEYPAEGLAALRRIARSACIVSVPREPLWRILNVARGKYVGALGNTPGHLNHWTGRGFERFLQAGGFKIVRRVQPLPWTVVLGYFA